MIFNLYLSSEVDHRGPEFSTRTAHDSQPLSPLSDDPYISPALRILVLLTSDTLQFYMALTSHPSLEMAAWVRSQIGETWSGCHLLALGLSHSYLTCSDLGNDLE